MRSVLKEGPWRSVGPLHLLRGLAVLIGLTGLAGFAAILHAQHGRILGDAELRAANTARALEHHAARTIETTDAYLRAVASLAGPQARGASPDALHASLRRQFVGSRELTNLSVVDSNGLAVAEAAAFPARPLDVSGRDYFQALRDRPGDTLAVGRPVVGALSGRLVIPIARRIEGVDGAFDGIVQASIDAEAFQSFYDALDGGAGTLLNLWRADGTLLVRSPPAPELIGGTYPRSETLGRHLAAGTTTPFRAPGVTDGAERIMALGFLAGSPLYVSVALAKAEVLAPWYRSLLTHGLSGLGLTLALVGALFLLARETERRRAAAALIRASERRFRLMAENSNDVILLGGLDLRVLYASPATSAVMGYAPEEIVGRTPFELVHPDDTPLVGLTWGDRASIDRTSGDEAAIDRTGADIADERRGVSCLRLRHKAGHHVWIEVSVRLARDELNGTRLGYVAALRDITERRRDEERLWDMALRDALTGLPNRTLFHHSVDQAIARSTRTGGHFAVFVCDLDRFKAINDSLGHPAGDTLLCVVADRMRAALRPDDVVARLGGDEFAIVVGLPDSPVADISLPASHLAASHLAASHLAASHLAERLIAAVSVPVDLDGRVVEVGLSIGFVLASGRDASADELFKRADMALYEAKAGGRNTHREFCPDVGTRIALRGQIGLDMKEALRRGEFHLVYQPVVEAGTGTVVSFEALMRWQHPSRGEIAPGEFIPLAEECGLIVPLGAWALREACRTAMDWPSSIRVAVNVSVVQLRRGGLEAAILEALSASGLPANRLKLEVTESVLMQDADAILASLHRLRDLGVLVALDDFGTGYSSLSYLRRFPFDKIKLDRGFIRDIGHPDAAAIVRAVVSIGERLGMGIVAEGVETAEQLELVRREGCAQVQGFLFSRPLPPREALAYALGHAGARTVTTALAA